MIVERTGSLAFLFVEREPRLRQRAMSESRRSALGILATVLVIHVSPFAHADEHHAGGGSALLKPAATNATPRTTEPSEETTTWYGWQLLINDGVAIGLLVTARESARLISGLVVYQLGAPVIHVANARGVHAAISAAGRLTGIVVAYVGAAQGGDCSERAESCRLQVLTVLATHIRFVRLVLNRTIDRLDRSPDEIVGAASSAT
jgi:hypothetical protein